MKNHSFLKFFQLFILAVCLLMIGCEEHQIDPKNEAIARVIERTLADVNKVNVGHRLYLIGTGGAADYNTKKKRMISISFEVDHPLNKEKCRWLIVECVEIFLKNINNDPDLPQYLSNNHFTYQNIELSIFFSNPDRSSLYYPDISSVSLHEGEVSFGMDDPKYKNGGYGPHKEVLYEPYEEAVNIVRHK